MNATNIKTWIENSGLYSTMPGAEKLTLSQQVSLVGAMAEMTGRIQLIEECHTAIDILGK